MHASSSSRPYAATHTSVMTTAHTVSTAHDVRATLALPVFLRFNPPSKLYLRLREYRCSADSAPPSVLLLRHAIAIHLIRISATSLTGSIPAPYHPSRAGRWRTHRRGHCLTEVLCSIRPSAWATLSSNVCSTVSNATSSSQLLAPSINKTSDALLAAACGRRDI
ncbi:hypothetical protein C8J57DRAFT_1518517 [Mycena rebaudengoi]|nr:hypothetical protein C8J57DRAFT_1518517 [Mycena rebaudengoi]